MNEAFTVTVEIKGPLAAEALYALEEWCRRTSDAVTEVNVTAIQEGN